MTRVLGIFLSVLLLLPFAFLQNAQLPIKVRGINGTIYVEGMKYKKTMAGIQAAINALPAGGGTVVVPAGTYNGTVSITIQKANVHVLGEPGAFLNFTPKAPFSAGINDRVFNLGCGPSGDRAIRGSIGLGTTTFTATSSGSTSDVVANDWLLIYLKDPNYQDAVSIDFAQVASVAGTNISTLQPIQQAFSPVGGQILQFQRMDANCVGAPFENISITGLKMLTNIARQSPGMDLAGIGVYWSKDVLIKDCVLEAIPGNTSINTLSVFRSKNVRFIHNRNVAMGTAAQNVQSEFAESTDVTIDDNVWESESSSAALINVELDFGLNRFTFTHNKINNASVFGLSVQAGIHDGVISGNTIGLVSGQEKGMNLLGMNNVVVSNNVLLGPRNPNFTGSVGIILANDTNAAPSLVSTGNTVANNKVGVINRFAEAYHIANSGDTWRP